MNAVEQGLLAGFNNGGATLPQGASNAKDFTSGTSPINAEDKEDLSWITPWKQEEWKREDRLKHEQWEREDAIRAYEAMMANNAYQRKFDDLEKAGISKYAAIALNSGLGAGSAVPQQGTNGNPRTANSDTGQVFGAIAGLFMAMITAGMSMHAANAKNSEVLNNMIKLETVRQADRVDLIDYKDMLKRQENYKPRFSHIDDKALDYMIKHSH